MTKPIFSRILLKLSGEILAGEKGFGLDPNVAKKLALEIKSVNDLGVSVGIVIGGGNIIRGELAEVQGMDRVSADYLGMLATIINSITLQDALEKNNCETRTLSALSISQLAEPYIRRRAIRHMEKNRIVICTAGTGNPYFSTDTSAALRAAELDCGVIYKATQVDGIYDKDPKKFKNAKKYSKLSFKKYINENLKVMDTSAIAISRDNKIPIKLFSIQEKNCFVKMFMNKLSHSEIS